MHIVRQHNKYLTDGAVMALLASEIDPTSVGTGWKLWAVLECRFGPSASSFKEYIKKKSDESYNLLH